MINPSNTCTFVPGIHAAEISRIAIARDNNGKPIANKETGEIAIRIEFRGSNAMHGSTLVLWNESTQYITDGLIKACKVDNRNRQVPVSEMIGKRLWIYVKGYYRIGEYPGINEPISTEIIPGKYSQFFGPKPAVTDDPDRNGGIPKGIFVEFVNISKTPVNLEEREFGDD